MTKSIPITSNIILFLSIAFYGPPSFSSFQSPEDLKKIRQHLVNEKKFSENEFDQFEKETVGSTVIQRSGRKRLYDQNIFLQNIVKCRILYKAAGDNSCFLRDLLLNSLFIDFGSAILNGIKYKDSAPTVRDIYEDKIIKPIVSKVIATDINTDAFPSGDIIDQFNRQGGELPFPLKEIPLLMIDIDWLQKFVGGLSNVKAQSLILRSASSGPDLYYSLDESVAHLDAITKAFQGRTVFYFFNKFVLFKLRGDSQFLILGEIEETVGFNHKSQVWAWNIDWKLRTLEQAFIPNQDLISILPSIVDE